MPSVKTSLLDDANGVRYDMFAYRQLTRAEALASVRAYLSQLKKRRRPKRGAVVEIVSIIGHSD